MKGGKKKGCKWEPCALKKKVENERQNRRRRRKEAFMTFKKLLKDAGLNNCVEVLNTVSKKQMVLPNGELKNLLKEQNGFFK